MSADGLLPCQVDAYAREVNTEVLVCEADSEGFLVSVADSVLYPGGGGQPEDAGFVGDARVLAHLAADAAGYRYRVDRAVRLGQTTVRLDWARRFDHMQQHTAQHILSAVALARFGWTTLAFHLNPDRCDLVLDGTLSPEALRTLEEAANGIVRDARPVRSRVIEREAMEAEGVRCRLLPAGHTGALRVVEIEGADLNTCGGTHVGNTAELQMIRIVATEHQRGQTRVHYLAGGRLLEDHRRAVIRARALNELLSCGSAGQVDGVQRALQRVWDAERETKQLKKELAERLGAGLTPDAAGVIDFHRAGAEMGFLNTVGGAIKRGHPDAVAFLTADGEGTSGPFLILGPAERVAVVGPAVAEVLEGRGGGKGGRFQGKATRIDRRDEALKLFQD